MKVMRKHGVNRLATLALVVGLTAGFARTGLAQSVSGQAYGAYVNTSIGAVSQSPLAVLPFISLSGVDGDVATAQADALNVGGALSSTFLNSITSGAIGTTAASAQSTATVANVNILGGLITAKEVIANVASSRTAGGAGSNAIGTTFANLTVAGTPVTTGDAPVAPNTQMSLPGVGYVVLNEQIPTGDGVTSSGITVNMIHVFLQSQVLGGTPTTSGEIIVGSAKSAVGP
jgi:hypothetical protein